MKRKTPHVPEPDDDSQSRAPDKPDDDRGSSSFWSRIYSVIIHPFRVIGNLLYLSQRWISELRLPPTTRDDRELRLPPPLSEFEVRLPRSSSEFEVRLPRSSSEYEFAMGIPNIVENQSYCSVRDIKKITEEKPVAVWHPVPPAPPPPNPPV